MKLTLSLLAVIFALAAPVFGQDDVTYVSREYDIQQYPDIEPGLKCRFKRNKWTFCKKFPNLARKWDVCDPALMGHIEWCREDVTITDTDECGEYRTYEATVITYRKVYANGAWGEKFRVTYPKTAFKIDVPPVIAAK